MNLRDLLLRGRALFTRRRVEQELDDELAFHVEREALKHVANGVEAADARRRALAKFGSVALAADACRDVRGTSLVEDCARDAAYAVRTFRRAPLSAFTIVVTVAIGLGLVAAVFTFFSVFLFRVDTVANPGELFAVRRATRPGADSWRMFTRPEYDALRRDTSVFVDSYASIESVDGRIDGRMMSGTLVTASFFETVRVSAALGRTFTAADEAPGATATVMVLSDRGWSRLFARDPGIVGRTLIVSGSPSIVVGVMPEGFRGLAVSAPDYWAPVSKLAQFRPGQAGNEDRTGLEVIGRLAPGMSRESATSAFAVWHDGLKTAPNPSDTETMVLEPRQGTVSVEDAMPVFAPVFFAFGLILLIGCANVANLLLARGVSRQRELGIRLSLGASRRRVIRQLLTESLLLALLSAGLAFVISRVVLEATIHVVMTTIATELAENISLSAPAPDWRVGVFLVLGAMVSTVFFGLAPALQATRLELIRTVRGEVMKDTRPRRARSLLIGVQVAASALLLICAAVFLRSAAASSTMDPGIRTSDTISIDKGSEGLRGSMLEAIRSEPAVEAMAAMSPGMLDALPNVIAEGSGIRVPLTHRAVSPEYFALLDIPILRGRVFTDGERTEQSQIAIVSESVARRLWPNREPIGQSMRLDETSATDPRTRVVTVVGIARDVAGFRFSGYDEAGVYLPTNVESPAASLIVRVTGDPGRARETILDRLTAFDPNMGQVVTMRTLAGMEVYFLRSAFWVTLVLGALALILTLSGLFSVLSHIVERRRKEIGVRMALGATASVIVRLVVVQSLRPVALGLLAGTAMAAGLASVLMATPAASQIGAVVHVFDPVAYGAGIVLIAVACLLASSLPAWRAAKLNPIGTLRQD